MSCRDKLAIVGPVTWLIVLVDELSNNRALALTRPIAT